MICLVSLPKKRHNIFLFLRSLPICKSHVHTSTPAKSTPKTRNPNYPNYPSNHPLSSNITTRPLTSQAPHQQPEVSRIQYRTTQNMRGDTTMLPTRLHRVLMPWGWIIVPLTLRATAKTPYLPHKDQPSPPPELWSQNSFAPPPYMNATSG